MKSIILSATLVMMLFASCDKSMFTPNNTGTSGSVTRFAISGNYMYAIDMNLIKVYDITDAENPEFRNSVELGYEIETIFSNENYLYIGANDGIFILDVTQPETPVVLSKYEHIVACDPVIAIDDIAYSTVRSGSACGGNMTTASSLLVIDVTDKSNPMEITRLMMEEPYGLAMDNDFLFVCNGAQGVRVFDITQQTNPVELFDLSCTDARDVIANNGQLIVSTVSNYQVFDYSDINHITLTTTINK